MSASDFALHGVQVWPTMLFTRRWENHASESSLIVDWLYELRGRQSAPVESGIAVGSKPAAGLYESTFDLFQQNHSPLQKLVRFIKDSLALAVSIANGQEVLPGALATEIIDSWYHITNDGGFHDAHVHNDCSWCGIYYLRLGNAGERVGSCAPNGGSRFYCPFAYGGSHRDYGNKYLTSSIDPPIEDGMLLLFPAYLWHSGLPYTGQIDRVIVAFNARVYLKS